MGHSSWEQAPRYSSQFFYNYVAQGVTTIFTGNCGHGFTSTDHWRRFLAGNLFGTNIGHFIPYGSLGEEVLGRQNTAKILGAESIRKICYRIEMEMEKGAWGLSTAFDSIPGCYAVPPELIGYAEIIRKYGGVYVCHIRNESGIGIIPSIEEAIGIGRQSGAAVHLSQFRLYKPAVNVTSDQILELLYRARRDGVNITASQNPYDSIVGPWGTYFIGHLLSNMGITPDYDLLKDIGYLASALEKILRVFPPASILITRHDLYAGKTIEEVSRLESRDPVQILAGMCTDTVSVVAFTVDRETMEELMAHDFVFTSSNGSLCLDGDRHHPRSFGTFPRKIKAYALEQGIVTLSAALRSMTSGPANFLHLRKRGAIAEGYYADLVVFDPAGLTGNLDYLGPNHYPKGMKYVMVNGRTIIGGERPAGEPAGELLTLNR